MNTPTHTELFARATWRLLLLLLGALLFAAPALYPAPVHAASNADPLAGLKSLGNRLGLAGDAEFLPPEQAFFPSLEVIDANTLRAQWEIADDIYMYRDKFAFELLGADGVTLGQPQFPAGKTKVDENFGEMVVYYDRVAIDIPLQRSNPAPMELQLVAKYQGCADAGFCYPPLTTTLPVALPAATTVGTTTNSQLIVSEQDRIANTLAGGNTAWIILAFFGFGLLLTFTPCVFPMVPILSSIIVGQGESITTRRAFTLSLVYVLAMALTYTTAGVIAALFGQNLQAAFQDPWILGAFSAVFVLLALSMFGFYDLQMPASVQARLTAISNSQKGGTLIGVAVMGFLSALIVGPCVAAPLAGALIYIGQTGDALLGGMALFAMSLGMGAPLLLLGTSAGKLLPRAGDWMNTIKAVFGVLLLAVAIWMLARILPGAITMALWAALVIVSGIYLGAIEPLGKDANGWQKLWKGVGLILLVYGVLMLVGAAAGGRDALQPLNGVIGSSGFAAEGAGDRGAERASRLAFRHIKGVTQLEQEIAAAVAGGRPVMLDFYADWCITCKELEKFTFSDAGVQAALSSAVLLQADVTPYDAQDQALLRRYGLIGPPAVLFFGPDGVERRPYRLVGFLNAPDFRAHAQQALR